MTAIQFIKNLEGLYRDANEVKIETLKDWLLQRNLNDFQIGLLYDEITCHYKYKTFPTLGEVNNFWQNLNQTKRTTEDLSPIERQNKFTEKWTVDNLIFRLQELRTCIFERKQLESHKIDFLHQWTDLWSEYQILIDQDREDKNHLEYVKNAIIKKDKFKSAIRKPVNLNLDDEVQKIIEG